MSGAALKQSVLNYKPLSWKVGGNENYDGRFHVLKNSEEFDDVETAIQRAQMYRQEIMNITRVQNVILWGQFICREQYLTTQSSSLSVIRKFLIIPKSMVSTALQYNLDPRRLGWSELTFTSRLNSRVYDDNALLVVLVLTCHPSNDFCPKCSSDYYIEYIINF